MKYYKDYQKKWIGESDIASVIARTWNDSYIIHFGGDKSYHAYIVDSECEIPDHYNLKYSFDGPWIMIFDDNQKTFDYHNWNCKKINIYQAGMYGIIIQFEGVVF